MKAAITTRYGPPEVLEIREVPKPEPKDHQLLIRIRASTVTMGDCEMRRFDMPFFLWVPLRLIMGIRKPRINILGQEVAGEVVSVGKKVTEFKVGDAVFGPTDLSLGAHAEYTVLSQRIAVRKPDNISFAEAAAVPTGGLNALYFIRKAKIRNGEDVLINGAGGSIGTYAGQMIKAAGATVTAVDSTSKLEMLRAIGADHVFDYTREDVTQSGRTFDVIFDVWGKRVAPRFIRSLKPDGRYITANPSLSGMLYGLWVSLTSRRKVKSGLAPYKVEELRHLKDLLETGQLQVVIDRTYPLEQIVEAHRYVETGKKAGNVVIEV